jgi:hypothetical protein
MAFSSAQRTFLQTLAANAAWYAPMGSIRWGRCGSAPPGSWDLSVSTGWDPETGRYGRVIRTLRTSSRRQAKAAPRPIGGRSGRVGTADPTVAQLLDRRLEHLERLGRSESTLHNYRRYIKRELSPAIGGVRRVSRAITGN